MKVYTETIKKTHSNLERLEKYFYKTQAETIIYSDEGVYQVINDDIKKVNINDCGVEVKKNYIDGINLYVDSSYRKTTSVNQQIPFEHTVIKVKKMHYRLQENAVITFCIELVNNNIHDYYFLTKENIDSCIIKKDIVTFLSLLK